MFFNAVLFIKLLIWFWRKVMASHTMSRLETSNSFLNFEATIPDHCDLQTQYVYESNVHSENVLSSLNDQRKKGVLCDITVVVEGVRIPAHKAVLAACSTYFNGLITDPENISHNIVLELSTVSKVAMECLLDFAYTSKLTISRKNICQILDAIRELDIKNIEYSCLNILKEKLLSHTESLAASKRTSTNSESQLKSKVSESSRTEEVNQVTSSELQKYRSVCSTREETAKGCKTATDMTSRCFEINQLQPKKITPPPMTNYCPAFAGLNLTQKIGSDVGASCSLGVDECCMTSTKSCSNQMTTNNHQQNEQDHHRQTSPKPSSSTPYQHTTTKEQQLDHHRTATDQLPYFSKQLAGLPYCPLLMKNGNLLTASQYAWQLSNGGDAGMNHHQEIQPATCVSFLPTSDVDDNSTLQSEDSSKSGGGRVVESFQLISSSPSECCFTATTSSSCPRTKNTCTNVVLPFSFDQITKLPRSDLQELLNKHPDLTQKQLNTIHELRRRGKNRIAAQRCRKRKMDFIRELQGQMDTLRNNHAQLMEDRRNYRSHSFSLLDKFQKLWMQIFTDTNRSKMKKMNEGYDPSDNMMEGDRRKAMAEYYKNEVMKLERFVDGVKRLPCENLPPPPPSTNDQPTNKSSTFEQSGTNDEIVILCHQRQNSNSNDLF